MYVYLTISSFYFFHFIFFFFLLFFLLFRRLILTYNFEVHLIPIFNKYISLPIFNKPKNNFPKTNICTKNANMRGR